MHTPKSYSVIISSIRQVRVSAICVTLITIFLFLSNSSIGKAQSTNELLANFEDLAQGTSGINIVDGGITFSNLFSDTNTPGVPFYVDSTTDPTTGFSLPNYLTFGGSGFGQFASADITFSGTATNASLEVAGYSDPSNTNNTLTLIALNGTNVVAMDTTYVFQTDSFEQVTANLTVSWVTGFNSLELLVNGPDNTGSLFFGLDNVQVTGALLVPEPSVSGLLCTAIFAATLLHWRLRTRIRKERIKVVLG